MEFKKLYLSLGAILLLSSCKGANLPANDLNHANTNKATYKILINHDEGTVNFKETINLALDQLRISNYNEWTYSLSYVQMPTSTLEEKQAYLAYIEDNNFDIFTSPNGFSEELVETNQVAELTNYMANSCFATGASKAAYQYYENKIYTIPYKPLNYGVIYYNVDIFDKLNLSIPRTKNEFLNVCEQIKEYEASENSKLGEDDEPFELTPFASSVGGNIQLTSMFLDGLAMSIDKNAPEKLQNKQINFSSGPYYEAIKFYNELLEKGYLDYDTSASGNNYSTLMEALSNGIIAMMVGYSYDYRTFSENTYNASRVMYFPVLDNDISDYGAYLPSANRVLDGLMISSYVENVETAVQLATTFSKAYGEFFYNFGDTRIPLFDPISNNWQRISHQPFDGAEEVVNDAKNILSSFTDFFTRMDNSNYVATSLFQQMIYNYSFDKDNYDLNAIITEANNYLAEGNILRV